MSTKQTSKPSRKTTWYIHAKDAHSNEVVASSLQLGQVSNEFSHMECADGKKRYLYKVPDYGTAALLWKSQKHLKATFEIFRSQDDGLPSEWKFPAAKKITPKIIKERSDKIKLAATMSTHVKY